MPSKEANHWGREAEKAAARKFGLQTRSTEHFDLVHPKNAFRYQVKSTEEYDGNGNPGRLRIWYEDYKAVAATTGTFIFVTYNPENQQYPINRIWKVPAKKVAEAVDGDWYASGHEHKGEQYKLPWSEVA
jgi:hypothetical protein